MADQAGPDLAGPGRDAEGLCLRPTETVTRLRRDREFRNRVLTAYDHSCAVCGFDVRLGTVVLVVEAAHIQWHQANGPNEERNGLALCSLHHWAFHLNAFHASPGPRPAGFRAGPRAVAPS
ncbi:MAG: HNH endonuclease, partial [Planctomycetaceae bacterium]|nr:HNH endonuclease [Planctomycetaceae bacterium]